MKRDIDKNRGKSLKKWSLAKAIERYRKLVEQGAAREHIKFARDKVLDLEVTIK